MFKTKDFKKRKKIPMLSSVSGFTHTPILALLQSFVSIFSKKKNTSKEPEVRSGFGLQQKTMPNLVSGFTLIETLVAITILLISIMGPMVLVQRGITSSRFSRSQIIAFYLDQEVMEFVRNQRDTNFIAGSNWLLGLSDCIGVGNKCTIDITDNSINSCGASCPLLKKSSDGLYGYGAGWDETSFRREINITQSITNPNEVFVQVEISWDGDSRNFIGKESIFKLN